MIVTGKFIPRRAVLRGAGAALALPLLDAMVPAFAATRNSAAKPVTRFAAVFVPMGAAKSVATNIDYWSPKTVGELELTPILSALEPVRDRALVISGLGSHVADTKDGGPHPRLQTAWLTGTKCKPTEGADIQAGISLDQIIAREFGKETQLDSLQLGIEGNDVLGTCAQRYSCAYGNTITWRTPTTPIPIDNNPRAVFERLFGISDSTDSRARLAYMRRDRSILDSVTSELARFQKGIGSGDRVKVDQYLDSVRDIERRIQKAEEQSGRELPTVDQPGGIPASFEEHARLMFDLQLLAYQTDLTRVITFMLGRELSGRTFPELGVVESHHATSHHQEDSRTIGNILKIKVHFANLFAQYVEKLSATPDGDGFLLDHMTIMYGAGMGDSNQHAPGNLPVLLVGGSGGRIRTGRHVKYESGTPLANLHLSLLDLFDVPGVTQMGDSTGRLQRLTDL